MGMHRIRWLTILATVLLTVAFGWSVRSTAWASWGGGGGGGGGGGCSNSGCTTPFAVPLPVAAVLAPTSSDATTDYYTLIEQAANASIVPGHTTPVLTYNGLYPGPTIKATRGRTVKVHVENNLSADTVVHLHGIHGPAQFDGGPASPISPGSSYDFVYNNTQSPRTMWYHDHAMDVTGEHVYRGLAGFYLLTDDHEQSLNLPNGANDVPMLLQDRAFNSDGTLKYTMDSTTMRQGFLGDTQLVNGAAQPYFKVANRKIRFRVLNGSNARYYKLQLSNGQPMIHIGNEAGLFATPRQMSSILLAPAERADIVVDFSQVPVGSSVTLQNGRYDSIGDLLRFDVNRTETDTSTVPATLNTFTQLSASQATVSRTFTISQDNGVWVFNQKAYDPNRIDASVKLNAIEIWTFDNHSGQDHPIHLHDVNFQVLDAGGWNSGDGWNGTSWNNGSSGPTEWKETVNVPSWSSVRIIAQFTDYTGSFVFHCHILEHEDMSLMGTFNVA